MDSELRGRGMDELPDQTDILRLLAEYLPKIFPEAMEILRGFQGRKSASAECITPVREPKESIETYYRRVGLLDLMAHMWLRAAASHALGCRVFLNHEDQLIAFPREWAAEVVTSELRVPVNKDDPFYYGRLGEHFTELDEQFERAANIAWQRRRPFELKRQGLPAGVWEQLIQAMAHPHLRASFEIKHRIQLRLMYPGVLVVSRIAESLDALREASVMRQLVLIDHAQAAEARLS